MKERDDLALFSADELAAGLARLATPQNGAEIAGTVAALPPAERPCYRWAEEVVLAVSSLSADVAERVRGYYGPDEETRALIAKHQDHFARFLSSIGEEHDRKGYRLQDVVIDIRPEAAPNLVPAYVAPRGRVGVNALAVATEAELSAALALMASDDNAREIASAVYSLPPEEQVHYDWDHLVVMLLSCVSESLAARVRSFFAAYPEEREELARQQRGWAHYIGSRPGRPEARFDLEEVIRDVRLEDAL